MTDWLKSIQPTVPRTTTPEILPYTCSANHPGKKTDISRADTTPKRGGNPSPTGRNLIGSDSCSQREARVDSSDYVEVPPHTAAIG